MAERLILSVMLMLVWVGSAKAGGEGETDTLTVFETTDSNNKDIPVYGYYADWYQKCEMIYPADYLQGMENSNISKMAFHTSASKAKFVWEAIFKVYLKEVAQSSFPTENLSFTDFSEVDPVYTGQLDATGDTMWVVFDKPFYYQGGNLLVVFHLTEPGSNYTSPMFMSKKDMSGACIRGRKRASYSLDDVEPSRTDVLPKVTFCYSPAEQQGLAAPTTLNAYDVTLTSATIEWTSTASAWQICVNDDEEHLIETTEKNYTFTGLETDKSYQIKVRAVNGDKVSDWSETIEFRTLYCTPDQEVEIRYELHYIGPERYYPGWKGNAIVVKDAMTGVELAEWKNDNGWDASGTLRVCLGRRICFEWKEGDTAPEDCSYKVYDHYGEEIFSGKGSSVFPVNYTVFSGMLAPVDLTASNIETNSATIGWTQKGDEEVTQWQLRIHDVEDNLITVDSNPFTLTGLEYDTQYKVMVRSYKDEDNFSEWSEPFSFNTAEICPKPKSLRSEPEATEATLSWEGTLNNYVLQYNVGWKLGDDVVVNSGDESYSFDLQRFSGKGSILIRHYNVPDASTLCLDNIVVTNPEGTTVFLEDFENCEWGLPAKLSTIDQDGDGYGWEIRSNDYEYNWVQFEGHSGLSSSTWKPGGITLTPDDWLIISDVELGGTLSFMGHGVLPDGHDNFAVYVFADNDMIEVPVSDGSTSFVATQLVNNAPYLWRVKGVRETDESRWASSSLVTPFDPSIVPASINVDDVTLNGATVGWTSDASAWQICVNGDEENLIKTSEKSYTFTDWEKDHYYEVKVRIVNGTQVSNWSESVTIRTLICSEEEKANISYELHGRDGDGLKMNAIVVNDALGTNAIVVKDALTDEELDRWAFGESANSGKLPVCLGRKIYFIWDGSGYANEYSYVVRDPYGETIFEGSKVLKDTVFYTVSLDNPRPAELEASDIEANSATIGWDERGGATQWQICVNNDLEHLILTDSNPYTLTGLDYDTRYKVVVRSYKDADDISNWSEPLCFLTAEIYPKPKNLRSEPEATKATLSWDGIADSYEVRYGKFPEGGVGDWTDDEEEMFTQMGSDSSEQTWTWGVMYPYNELNGNVLKKIALYETEDYNTEDITISVYSGGDKAPGTLLYTEVVTPKANDEYHEIELTTPVYIPAGENIWVVFSEYGTYPMACYEKDTEVDSNKQWCYYDDDWHTIRDFNYLEYGWMVRAYVDNLDEDEIEWTAGTCDDTSFSMTNLEPQQKYISQVRSNYGSIDHSKWISKIFTTDVLKIQLANDATDNATLVETYNGKEANVTLTDRTLYKDGKWNTICLPFDVDLTDENSPLYGADARELEEASITGDEANGHTLHLSFSEAVTTLEAGVPYIIKWEEGDNITDPVFPNVTISNTYEGFDNGVAGDYRVRFLGTYNKMVYGKDKSVLFMGSSNNLYYPDGKKQVSLGACRAYFRIGENNAVNAKGITGFVIDFGEDDEEATAIHNAEFIMQNDDADAWFTLDGSRLSGTPAAKGIYIHNGKKVVVE